MKTQKIRWLALTLLIFNPAWLYAQALEAEESTADAWQLPALDEVFSEEQHEAIFNDWPAIGEVLDAAMKNLAGTLRGPHTWRARRSLASLLPVVRVGESVREGNYDRYLLERDPYDRYRLDDYSLDDGLREYDSTSIWLQWDLSDLLFHQDEMEAASVERELAEFRSRFSRDVITSYHKLKQCRLLLARQLVSTEAERVTLAMEADVLTDYLDHVTGGFFKQALAED